MKHVFEIEVFPIILVEIRLKFFDSDELTGPIRFGSASQALIDSPTVPPQVKQIFKGFLAALAATEPCVSQGDRKCILDTFQNVGVKGMQEGVEFSSGPLKQLFEKLLRWDRIAVSDISALQISPLSITVKVADIALNKKANDINKYLGK